MRGPRAVADAPTPDPSFIVGPTRFGRMFKRSREWGRSMLQLWWAEQQAGGPMRVFSRGKQGQICTTIAIVDQYMPRGRRDEVLERRLATLERDLGEAYVRLAALERSIGKRR